nr:predicted GPI-anchored protein 58 isoform X2 [Ovis aries]
MPPSAAPAAPFGAPAFWVPGTAPGVCVGQPLMIFMVQPSPGALWPSGKPPPPAQVAGPWAVSSPAGTALGQPGQGAILPPAQPEAHIPRWPGSPYGEGAAPPLEPQPQPRSLPSPTSLLDELLAAAGAPASPGPSPGAAAGHGVDPALPGAPSLLDGLLVAAGAPASPGPSPGPLPTTGWTLPCQAHPASSTSSWRPRAPRLAGAFPGALCRRGATGSSRWHTQPPRANLGCHRHPRHAGAFPGALCR